MELSDYAQALGAAQRLVPNWRQGDAQEADLATARMQPQLIQAQIARSQAQSQQEAQEAAFKEQRRAEFQSGLTSLGGRPTPQKLYQLSAQFPEFATQIQGAAKGISTEDGAKVVRNLAPVQSLIQNGKYDLAAAEVKRHIDADKAAGIEPDEHDTELYGMLTSGDPDQAKSAGGIVYGLLSALNPETAAKNIGDRQEGTKPVNVGAGSYVVSPTEIDPATGKLKVLFSAPAAPDYRSVKNADGTESIVQVGGGDPASSGGAAGGSPTAPAGRTQYGWTPRARNGGDNTDAAVDGKIKGMTAALGIDPTAPFPPGTTNLQIAQALTLSEGGKGSVADRNNNPGNLTDPKTGSYRKFATKEAGLQAAAAQVARNRSRGQNTIQSMVEGLPVSGGRSGPVAQAFGSKVVYTSQGAAPDDDSTTGEAFLASLPAGRRNLLKNISEGRAAPPKPGSKFGEKLAEDLARAYPDADTTQFATRQQAMKAFSSGTQGNTVRSLNVAIDHLGVLHDAALALHNGNTPLFNKLSQRFQKETGSPLPSNAKAIAGIVGDEVTKAVVGSAGALADREDIKSTLNTAGSPAQIMGITRSYISLMAGQAKGLQQQYEQATGNKDFGRFLNHTTAKQLGISRGAATKNAPGPVAAPKGGKLVGTYQGRQVFQLSDGRRVVAK